MEVHRQHEDLQNAGLNPVVEDEGDQHHEKKSMLTKVKNKAKKIRNTITKRGNGGHDEQDNENNNGTDDLEEDEGDADDLMEEDPAVHSSSAYKPDAIGNDTNGGQGINMEKPTALREDRYPTQVNEPITGSGYVSGRPMAAEPERNAPSLTDTTGPRTAEPERNAPSLTDKTGPRTAEPERNAPSLTDITGPRTEPERNAPSLTDKTGPIRAEHEEKSAPFLADITRPREAEQEMGNTPSDKTGPMRAEHEEKSAPFLADITRPREAEQEMGNTPSTDITGRKEDEGMQEGGIKIGGLPDLQEDTPTPMDTSNSQSKTVDPSGKGGQEADIDPLIRSLEKASIHDKSPASTGSHDQFVPESNTTSKTGIDSDSFPKTHDSSKPEDLPQDMIHGKASDQGSYIGMITGVPSAISGKAIAAKNAVASKLGYGGTESPKSPESGIREPPAFTGSNDQFAPEDLPQDTKQGNQGSYIGKTGGVPSTIADKAIAAKNAVASKLGYGGTPESGAPKSPASAGSNDQFTIAPESLPQDTIQGKASDQGSYIGKISGVPSTITDKAIAAKNVVASKLGYGGTESATAAETGEFVGAEKPVSSTPYMQGMASKVTGTLAPVYAKAADTGSSVISRVKGTGNKDETSDINKEGTGDRGVSMKDYLSEKFRPGDDDKALSRGISDTLQTRKENLVKSSEPKSVGKVIDATEGQSTVLAEATREGDDVKVAGPENVNKGVVDYVKDTVGSWMGKGGQQQQHTEGSPKSHTTTEDQAAGEIEHPLSVSEDKKID